MTRLVSVALVLVCALFALQAEAEGLVDNGDGTVTDDKTGLMWQKQDDGNMYNWYQASGSYDAADNPTSQNVCGRLNLGGHSDWRLPSKRELVTILAYFWNTKHTKYWSSTTVDGAPGTALYVSFDDEDGTLLVGENNGMVTSRRWTKDDGYVFLSFESYANYVRCVRGGI
ncbi:MAG: DUF1566 domain-containing protein [Geobacteraceae bacterium]|nr:DUF1566 domain-containing protein [Geobacteraceae bacterium]